MRFYSGRPFEHRKGEVKLTSPNTKVDKFLFILQYIDDASGRNSGTQPNENLSEYWEPRSYQNGEALNNGNTKLRASGAG